MPESQAQNSAFHSGINPAQSFNYGLENSPTTGTVFGNLSDIFCRTSISPTDVNSPGNVDGGLATAQAPTAPVMAWPPPLGSFGLDSDRSTRFPSIASLNLSHYNYQHQAFSKSPTPGHEGNVFGVETSSPGANGVSISVEEQSTAPPAHAAMAPFTQSISYFNLLPEFRQEWHGDTEQEQSSLTTCHEQTALPSMDLNAQASGADEVGNDGGEHAGPESSPGPVLDKGKQRAVDTLDTLAAEVNTRGRELVCVSQVRGKGSHQLWREAYVERPRNPLETLPPIDTVTEQEPGNFQHPDNLDTTNAFTTTIYENTSKVPSTPVMLFKASIYFLTHLMMTSTAQSADYPSIFDSINQGAFYTRPNQVYADTLITTWLAYNVNKTAESHFKDVVVQAANLLRKVKELQVFAGIAAFPPQVGRCGLGQEMMAARALVRTSICNSNKRLRENETGYVQSACLSCIGAILGKLHTLQLTLHANGWWNHATENRIFSTMEQTWAKVEARFGVRIHKHTFAATYDLSLPAMQAYPLDDLVPITYRLEQYLLSLLAKPERWQEIRLRYLDTARFQPEEVALKLERKRWEMGDAGMAQEQDVSLKVGQDRRCVRDEFGEFIRATNSTLCPTLPVVPEQVLTYETLPEPIPEPSLSAHELTPGPAPPAPESASEPVPEHTTEPIPQSLKRDRDIGEETEPDQTGPDIQTAAAPSFIPPKRRLKRAYRRPYSISGATPALLPNGQVIPRQVLTYDPAPDHTLGQIDLDVGTTAETSRRRRKRINNRRSNMESGKTCPSSEVVVQRAIGYELVPTHGPVERVGCGGDARPEWEQVEFDAGTLAVPITRNPMQEYQCGEQYGGDIYPEAGYSTVGPMYDEGGVLLPPYSYEYEPVTAYRALDGSYGDHQPEWGQIQLENRMCAETFNIYRHQGESKYKAAEGWYTARPSAIHSRLPEAELEAQQSVSIYNNEPVPKPTHIAYRQPTTNKSDSASIEPSRKLHKARPRPPGPAQVAAAMLAEPQCEIVRVKKKRRPRKRDEQVFQLLLKWQCGTSFTGNEGTVD